MSVDHLPIVSIITVSFNASTTIERTICSVLEQNYPAINYIIIDGGSTDDTVDIIRRYSAKIDHWISERDQGISHAFNKGLELAAGELITFVNADDWLSSDQISNAVEALNTHRDASFVYGDLICYRDGRPLYRNIGRSEYRSTIHRRIDYLNHPTLVAKKFLFREVGGFDLTYKRAMDFEWLQRVDKFGYFGVYSDRIVGNFSLGGVSHTELFQALSEVRQASILHHGRPVGAWVYYAICCSKAAIRIVVERIISPRLACKLREKLNSAVCYIE